MVRWQKVRQKLSRKLGTFATSRSYTNTPLSSFRLYSIGMPQAVYHPGPHPGGTLAQTPQPADVLGRLTHRDPRH